MAAPTRTRPSCLFSGHMATRELRGHSPVTSVARNGYINSIPDIYVWLADPAGHEPAMAGRPPGVRGSRTPPATQPTGSAGLQGAARGTCLATTRRWCSRRSLESTGARHLSGPPRNRYISSVTSNGDVMATSGCLGASHRPDIRGRGVTLSGHESRCLPGMAPRVATPGRPSAANGGHRHRWPPWVATVNWSDGKSRAKPQTSGEPPQGTWAAPPRR